MASQITLGGVELPDATSERGELLWPDQRKWRPVSMDYGRTLGGALTYSASAISGGRPITLVAADGVCWITAALASSLHGLAATAGSVVDLVWYGTTYRVLIDAIVLEPVWDEPACDYWTGEIRLVEVIE